MEEFLQHFVNGLILGGAYALIGIGLTLILGIMNVVNFAHGELYMLGAYLVYTQIQFARLSFLWTIPIAALAVMALGWTIEKTLLRPQRGRGGDSTMMVLIGLHIVIQNAARFIWSPLPQPIPNPFPPKAMSFGPIFLTQLRLFCAFIAMLCMVATHLLVQKTKMGKAMRATFQDRDMAALLGVRIDGIYAFTFAYGSLLAAVSGALLGAVFTVHPTMGDFAVVKAFAVVILGGTGSFPGAILGGLILGVAENLGSAYVSSALKDAFAFALIILILVMRPAGLLGSKIKKV